MGRSTIIFQSIPEKSLFRPDEVACIFRVHIRTIYRWEAEGKIESVRLSPSCIRFPYSAVVKFLNSST